MTRVLCPFCQLSMIKGLCQKKAHIMEIQVNGGTIADKVGLVLVTTAPLS